MVSVSAVFGMALVAFGMVLTPGPNMIYLVSRSISQGWRAGMMSLAGTMVGFLIYMTMANVRLPPFLSSSRGCIRCSRLPEPLI